MRLILLGAPGTGKGVQGNLLSQFYKIPNISTGDMLRSAIEKDSTLGSRAKKYIEAGELVPDEIIIEIVKQRLEEKDCKDGFILDGFPRTVPQAEALDAYLESNNHNIKCVIALEVDQQKIIERLTSRRVCRSCGKDYNIITNPPPKNNKCERCGGQIWQRSDDKETTVIKRLQVYEQKTRPLKEYYNRKSKLKIFKGDGSIEDVQRSIQECLSIDDNHKKFSRN